MSEPRPESAHVSEPPRIDYAESATRVPVAAGGAHLAQSDGSDARAVPDAVEVGGTDYVGRLRSRRARLEPLREQLRSVEDRLESPPAPTWRQCCSNPACR
jgi:hypothetical protein